MKVFFLRWFISWCGFVQGLLGILTLGYCKPPLELWAAKKYSSEKWVREYEKNSFIEIQR